MGKSSSHSPLPAGIYARISRDKEGAGLGVDRQEADCRALAKRLGWEVVAVFVDNDISAYSGAPRPQYRAMLDAVRAGEIRGILAWHTDRLHRRPAELEEFISLAEVHDLPVQTVRAGNLDLSTPSGRMVARMLGAAARHEVDSARDRIKRAKAQAAEQGKYRGGPRPYGYEKNGVTIREAEASVIREATTALLAGRSLQAVARELNAAGKQAVRMKRPKGAPADQPRKPVKVDWTAGALRDALLRPRNAGLLAHGAVRSAELTIKGKAGWPAIVPEEQWRTLYAMLTNPSRRTTSGSAPKWLGSGIYRCGVPVGDSVCGAVLRATATGETNARPNHKRTGHYRCSAEAHLMITAGYTDEHVRGVVAELVRDARVVGAMNPADPELPSYRERRTALIARLDAFERDYLNGDITGELYKKATTKVKAELEEVEQLITGAVQRSTGSPILNAADPGQAFLDAPLDVQRAVLATVLRVEVLPRPEALRGTSWTPDRLRLTPATEAA